MQVTNQVNKAQAKQQNTNFGSAHFKFSEGKKVSQSFDELNKFVSYLNDAAKMKQHKSLVDGKPLLQIEDVDAFGAKVTANTKHGYKAKTELKVALLAEKLGFKVGHVDNYAYEYQKVNGNGDKVLNKLDLAI